MPSQNASLTLLWVVIQLMLFAFVICSAIAASKTTSHVCENPQSEGPPTIQHSGGSSKSHGETFVLIWQALLAVALSCAGTYIMRKLRDPLSLGFFIGVVVMMANIMLLVAVTAGDRILRRNGAANASCPDCQGIDEAVAVFAVILFLLYTVYALLVWGYRGEILGEAYFDDNGETDESEEDDVSPHTVRRSPSRELQLMSMRRKNPNFKSLEDVTSPRQPDSSRSLTEI